jgi:hypothetical protein
MVTAVPPLFGMLDSPRAHHVEVDISETPLEMFSCLDGGRMVTIFPKGTLTTFPGIVLLARSPGDQLDQIGNLVLSSPVPDDDVDMVRGNRVVQDLDRKPFTGLIQPMLVALTGSSEFEQEFPFVAAVSNMPDVAGQKKSIRSWHGNSPSNIHIADAEIYKPFFAPKNGAIRPSQGKILVIFPVFFIAYLGPTPHTGTELLFHHPLSQST